MWDIIRQNKRRSWLLLGLMGIILILLGFIIGGAIHAQIYDADGVVRGVGAYGEFVHRAVHDEDFSETRPPVPWIPKPQLLLNGGGFIGMGVAMVIWSIMAGFAFLGGDSALLRTARAIPVVKEGAPQLWNVVEEMSIAAGLPKPPDVYLIEDDVPNAFAVGLTPERASVAVTSGLARRMSRDELQGVVAHEIAHIHNYDTRFMTLASVMLGSIALVSEVFLRSLRFSGGRRSSNSGKGGGGAIVLFIIAVLFAVLAPIAAHALYFACSRRREYLADACAARFTRYPPGLASALEKIGRTAGVMEGVSRSTAALYIVNPLQSPSSSSIFSSHPPLEKRIAILRAMSGAGYVDYEKAFHNVTHEKGPCLNPEFLKNETTLRMRDASRATGESPAPSGDISTEALAMVSRAAAFISLACGCGAKLKLPPGMAGGEFKCPRCAAAHVVPAAKAVARGEKGGPALGAFAYQRTGGEWEAFQCPCGMNLQLSPKFSAKYASCKKCGRHILIEPAPSSA